MELGSDFELNPLNLAQVEDNVFNYLKDYNAIYLDSGRSAIRLLKERIKGEILLPSYICDSVIGACEEIGNVSYYKVDAGFNIDIEDLQEKLTEEVKAVYVMHYFGALQGEECLSKIKLLQEKYPFVIVEDTTHSVFTSPCTIGDYCVCSLRKWFAIPDGAVLYSKKDMSDIIADKLDEKNVYRRLQAMLLKHTFINDNVDCNKIYREIFEETEQDLDSQKDIYRMSAVSEGLLFCYSINKMVEKRKTNYERLLKSMSIMGVESVLYSHDIVPLAFPIVNDARDELRTFLIKNQVYCAVHWPMPKELAAENNVSEKILSLPLDQRYGRMHMEYMIAQIKNYLESK